MSKTEAAKGELVTRSQEKLKNLKTVLLSAKKEIEGALPRHLTPDRMLRIATNEARKTPKLLECDQYSFFGAVIQACQLGLEPGGSLGHCWLIPYFNRDNGQFEVQFQIGYRGMIDIGYRSERVSKIQARAVYQGDHFEYEFGVKERLEHKPAGGIENPTHFYAIVTLRDGTSLFDVMTKGEVDKVREKYTSEKSKAWRESYDEMAKKTVLRRLFKWAPVSIEIQQAVGLDELAEADVSQNNALAFPAEPKQLPQSREEELRSLVCPDEHTDHLDESEKLPFEKNEGGKQ